MVCRPRSRWFSLPGAQPGVFQLPDEMKQQAGRPCVNRRAALPEAMGSNPRYQPFLRSRLPVRWRHSQPRGPPGDRRAHYHDAACLACRRGVFCFQAVGWGEVNRAACEGVKTMDWATIAVIAELGALESQ